MIWFLKLLFWFPPPTPLFPIIVSLSHHCFVLSNTHQIIFPYVMLLECALVWGVFVSFRSLHASQSWKQSSKWTLFIPVSSLVSLSHTLTIVCVCVCMPHSNKTVQFSTCVAQSTCNTITFIPFTDHSLIHSPANTFTFNWPFAHTKGTRYHTSTCTKRSKHWLKCIFYCQENLWLNLWLKLRWLFCLTCRVVLGQVSILMDGVGWHLML